VLQLLEQEGTSELYVLRKITHLDRDRHWIVRIPVRGEQLPAERWLQVRKKDCQVEGIPLK
jgi:hypothetical protein